MTKKINENIKKKGLLVSKAKYPITLKYNKENIIVPPRGRTPIDDVSLLGPLPELLTLRLIEENNGGN